MLFHLHSRRLQFLLVPVDVVMTLPLSGLIAFDHPSPVSTIVGLCTLEVAGNGRALEAVDTGAYYGWD